MKKIEIPIKQIINNIIVSDKEVWAYYRLSDKPYSFLSNETRNNLAKSVVNNLAALCQKNKRVDCHLQITNIPINSKSWSEQVRSIYNHYNKNRNLPFEAFVQKQTDFLKQAKYEKRVTYLGVKLFNRNAFDINSMNVFEIGFKDFFSLIRKNINNVYKFNSEEVSKEEMQRAESAENEIYRILQQEPLRAKRMKDVEILLNIKDKFYPALQTPYLEYLSNERINNSDIMIETGSIMEVAPRYLKFNQIIDNEEREGYRAVLSFSKIPDGLNVYGGQQPLLNRRSTYPYTVNARFSLLPPEDLNNVVKDKKLELKDEIKNSNGDELNAGDNIRETLDNIKTLEESLKEDKLPWCNGNYRITVTAQSEEELKQVIASIKAEYFDEKINLVWSNGDQLELFLEEIMGDRIRNKSFTQTTNLAMFGISGINHGGQVGDPVIQKEVFRRTDVND